VNGTVLALAVFDDGHGPALYAGGSFTTAGGAAASRIARWDGSSWSAVGSGLDGPVWALLEHDDGSGPALHAGGSCDGTFAQDLNAFWTANPFKRPGIGALGQVQLWYRDPQNTSSQTTSLSDAVKFTVQP